ncbi:unnamed protein product [Polarella glacialis]|uniref:Uncharacterized protein n=1 Tax=Polarella glacialis TaxID=89957 RepID=A0A813D407_POLGL|nr:unnamed protein product [Polarella glacialis]
MVSESAFPSSGRPSAEVARSPHPGLGFYVPGTHCRQGSYGDKVPGDADDLRPLAVQVASHGRSRANYQSLHKRREAVLEQARFENGITNLLNGVTNLLNGVYEGRWRALPGLWYEPEDEAESAVPCHVAHFATSETLAAGKASGAQTPTRHEQLLKQCAVAFPEPADDLVILVCGPRQFVNDLCLPILRELGHKQVITLW